MRLRALLTTILKAKEAMGKAFKDGNFAMAEVKYAAGDIKSAIIESVGTAQKRVETRVDNIAGVKVPATLPRRLAHRLRSHPPSARPGPVRRHGHVASAGARLQGAQVRP